MSTLLQSAARVSHSSEMLGDIKADDCNLAIWERSLPTRFERLLTGTTQDLRFTARLVDLDENLLAELVKSGFDRSPERDALCADVLQLAGLYCSILDIDKLAIRLERITTNACRKFHSDYVSARLITTYVGPGTDWLDTHDATQLRRGNKPEHIRSLKTGDVGIFKGRLATTDPAIHRSPPIEDTGQERLLLALDPALAN